MSSLLDFLFPRYCFGCHHSHFYLCSNCLNQILVNPVRKIPPLDGVVSPFPYHGSVKNLIHSLKYEYVTDVIPEISTHLSAIIHHDFKNILHYWQENQFVLVPIPLHSRRLHWRGFNQAELLARSLSPLLSLNYDASLLSRPQFSSPQAQIRRSKRVHRLTSVFSLNPRSALQTHPNIILVDDVCTTGSTLISAASCFPRPSQIWGLTLAG